MKLWQGRLGGDVDERLDRLNKSIGFDARMYRQDITGSIAHARMLGKIGVLTEEEKKAIVTGLQGILADIDAGKLQIDMSCEDIHTFVEGELTRRIGQPGKKLHTARSRKRSGGARSAPLPRRRDRGETRARCKTVVETLCDVAEKHLHTVMPGYTHLQRAQPVDACPPPDGLRADAAARPRAPCRVRARTLISPLGSGALAGTGYPLDRQFVAEQLHMNGVSENSLDAVATAISSSNCLRTLPSSWRTFRALPRKFASGARGSSASWRWTTASPPALPSCRKRRTPTSPNSSAARPAHLRLPDHASDGGQGPAACLQQGSAGGQGGRL